MKPLDDLTDDERAEADTMVADLRGRGYRRRKRFNELAPGVRVRHCGHQWPEAYADGTAVVVAITERDPSAWAREWRMPDIEMVVAYDRPILEGRSRLVMLAQYHVQVVNPASSRQVGP